MLKCPICGKDYSYDRKICLECEEYSINSGLVEQEEGTFHAWNCAIFSKSNNLVFGTGKSLITKISMNGSAYFTEKTGKYKPIWNCEVAIKSDDTDIKSEYIPEKLDYIINMNRDKHKVPLLYE